MNYNLQSRLDDFLHGDCTAEVLVQELCDLCDATSDSAWEVLALIDQYYRRGKLSAELFQTIRYRIERRVLGVRDSDPERELSRAAVPPEATITAGDRAAATRGRVPTPKNPAGYEQALQEELLGARAMLRRYRKRLKTLAEYGHRTRSALANTQRELSASRMQVMGCREQLASKEWRRSVREQFADEATGDSTAMRKRVRTRRAIRLPEAVALAAVVLAVGASPALQELPQHREMLRKPALPTVAVPAMPRAVVPGEISLSTAQYVVFPGHVSADIQVQRTGGTSGEVSFVWWTRGSGAKPGVDYRSGAPRIANMPDGVDTMQLSVPILANPSRKHTELFYVMIGRPGGGASLGSIKQAAVVVMRPD